MINKLDKERVLFKGNQPRHTFDVLFHRVLPSQPVKHEAILTRRKDWQG